MWIGLTARRLSPVGERRLRPNPSSGFITAHLRYDIANIPIQTLTHYLHVYITVAEARLIRYCEARLGQL